MDLDRLRKLTQETVRTPMSRAQQYPTMTSQLLLQKQEIAALRLGLLEAVTEIERLNTLMVDYG
jgi:hypothetical protein